MFRHGVTFGYAWVHPTAAVIAVTSARTGNFVFIAAW
jgi:hypothetical protein